MPEQEETLLTWKSPSRPFKKREKEFFTTIAAIVFLLAVILVFVKEFLLIGAIVSLAFVAYVLATIPPEIVEHRITTLGIESAGHFYKWDQLIDFWFGKKWEQEILYIASKLKFPGRLVILIEEKEKEKIKTELSKYLTFKEKPVVSWMDNAGKWLGEKVPLENK